ncbi:MAG: hypothetical protein PHN89_05775 [Candidatus Pacebacteria bacterium]|nr:hypothetical protein [Candidatus Paceibacterota bacterium]
MGNEIGDEEFEKYLKQQEEYDELLYESREKEENMRWEDGARSSIDEIFNNFLKIKEETIKDNTDNTVKAYYRLECFLETVEKYTGKPTKKNFALYSKSIEIIESARDSFFLSIVGRYKTAYLLMRKMLELFAVAEYIDVSGISESKKSHDWVFKSDTPPISISDAIKEIDKNNSLKKLYGELCSFAHNEGTQEYDFIWDYDKKGFEIYVEKMVFLSDYLCEVLIKRMKACADGEPHPK